MSLSTSIARLTSPAPQFDLLVSVSTADQLRAVQVKTHSYRAVSISESHDRRSCVVTTADGQTLTVVGPAVAELKPGLKFNARTIPFPINATRRTMWLVETNPMAVTDPAKMVYPPGVNAWFAPNGTHSMRASM